MGVLVVPLAEADIDSCSDWLFQLGATAIEERPGETAAVLIAGFESDELALAARSLLVERWPCRLEATDDESTWRDEWLRHIAPVSIGRFLIHAPWHDVDSEFTAGDRISIEPGRAFGSGHHPTTQLVIGLLEQFVGPDSSVLDAGCGTGILSIVASKLGAGRVVGLDVDLDVLEVARANAEANAATHALTLTEEPIGDLADTFDIGVANIVIGDLRPLLTDLISKTTGVLIVSGFLADQLDSLVEPHLGQVSIVTEVEHLGWAAVALAPTSPTLT